MRVGVRLGIDVGKARIGVARCDPHGMLATPLETVPRDRAADARAAHSGAADGHGNVDNLGERTDLSRIFALADEYDAIELVVGLPLGLSGHRTPSTEDAEIFARRLARHAAEHVLVRLVDERLSTVTAQGQLRQAGKKTKQTRSVIDQAAAVVILQHAIDSERSHGNPPGTVVETDFTDPDARKPDSTEGEPT